jgi:hypothetical protein
MEIFIVVLTILGLLILGAAINQFIFLRKKEKSLYQAPSIPEKIPAIPQKEREIVEIYLKEWQIIIETQMHFNDLILRFRSVILTTYVTLIGAVTAISKLGVISEKSVFPLFLLVFSLWVTSFFIDFFYYHRLLIGSVRQADKYDKSNYFRSHGLFGMTAGISNQVRPLTSRWLVILYYSAPAAVLWIIFLILHFGG